MARFDTHPPAAVETQPADGLRTVIAPDDPQDRVLAGRRAGMPFTKKGKAMVKKENAEKNDGKNRAEQHQQGVTPPPNEAQVDHVIPRAKGGEGAPANGQVLCRDCNIKKSDKAP